MGRVVITGDVIYSSTFVLQGSLILAVYNFGAQCVGRFVDVFRLVDSSKLFGETCYVGYSQHRVSGVGDAGSRSVLCSGLAGLGDLWGPFRVVVGFQGGTHMYEFGFLVCLVGDVLLSSGGEGTYY